MSRSNAPGLERRDQITQVRLLLVRRHAIVKADAERRRMRSHENRGNEKMLKVKWSY
jgi:hypothetical protein